MFYLFICNTTVCFLPGFSLTVCCYLSLFFNLFCLHLFFNLFYICMTVNVAKTEVCPISGPFDVDSICAAFGGAKVTPYSELELLGSPIGPIDSPDQLSGSVEIRLEQIATLGQSLQGLSSHHRLFLLKHCVGIPRLLYMIRSSPCFLAPEVLRNIDASFRQFLTETLNIQLDDKAWRQASLPVKAGGLGVRRIEDLALPAYLSSSSAAEALVLQIAPSGAEPFGLLVSAALEAWSAAAGNGVCHRNFGPGNFGPGDQNFQWKIGPAGPIFSGKMVRLWKIGPNNGPSISALVTSDCCG